MKYLILLLLVAGPIFAFRQAPTSWVAIGDSITYLNDHPDETGNRITKGYLTLIGEQFPSLKITNQGHNGWTSGGIAEKFGQLGVPKADLYSIFLGTNDWWQGRPVGTLDDYKNNTGNNTVNGSFRIITDQLKALNPAAKIILITPLQRGDFVYINSYTNNAYGSYRAKKDQLLEQFANAIAAIAAYEKFELVDLYHKSGITQKNMVRFKRLRDPATGEYKNYRYPEYIDKPFDPAKDEYPYPLESIDMTYDGLHPSDKGYKVIAAMLGRVMKKYK